MRWIQAFLSNLRQSVFVDDDHSEYVPETPGVPQDSVLGTIHFLSYTNDLPQDIVSQIRLFADDTTNYLTRQSLFTEGIRRIEMAQGRAARGIINDYSVTSLLHQLGWQTLEERRSTVRLCLLYKILNGLVALPLPKYIQSTHRISRCCHSMTIHTDNDSYKYLLLSSGYCSVECPPRKCCNFFKS